MSKKIEQYQTALQLIDIEGLGRLRHPDYTCTYPQSGEVFKGHDNWAAAHRNYAERVGLQDFESAKVRGGEQRTKVATTTSGPLPFQTTPVVQISDTGDLVTLEGSGTWPDGKVYHWVTILEYRDGLVWRETQYFAEPFEAPQWRSEFTEPTS